METMHVRVSPPHEQGRNPCRKRTHTATDRDGSTVKVTNQCHNVTGGTNLFFEMFCLLEYTVVLSVEIQLTFRSNMSPPSSQLKNKPSRALALLLARFMQISCLAYSVTVKMGATYSSEMSVDFQRTTWRYIPEDRTLHNHRCENLKSYETRG
jgi:hypothetical protein